jgi:hypothetical protein
LMVSCLAMSLQPKGVRVLSALATNV